MAWSSSDRRAHLPRNWQALRLRVFDRDGYLCQIAGPTCTGLATEVDHINGRDNHGMGNLRAVCSRCHKARTNVDAKAAQAIVRARGKRPPEPHPGIT
jgi:5-methylcytosine-specific restriction endonuclease McrA